MIDFGCESKVGGEDTAFDVLVVSIDEISDCKWSLGVVGAESVLEAIVLLCDPGESAFFYEDVVGQFC